MTKSRQIYYRRKDKSIVIEGKKDGASILIWTLPNDPTSLIEFLLKASYFPEEKAQKIKEKVERLDYKPERESKGTPKVPTAIIKRTDENDAKLINLNIAGKEKLGMSNAPLNIRKDLTEEEKKDLWEMTK